VILTLNSSQNGFVQIFIYGIDGRLVQSFVLDVTIGFNALTLDLSHLAAGTCSTKIVSPDLKFYDQKIIKTR